MTALPLSADRFPLCGFDHEQLDVFWACPEHGHRVRLARADGDRDIYYCPVRKCRYQRTAPRKPRSPSKGDPMTAAETRPSAAVDLIYARAAHLKSLLPAQLDLDSFLGTAQAALYNNADLMAGAENSPDSLMIALTECASLGHYPDGKNYYLTPRKRKGQPIVLGVEGYRGVVQRMYNSGLVGKVVVREVCERDEFDFTEGMDDYPVHRFAASSERTGAGYFGRAGSVHRGDMVGVYAYAKLISGDYTRVALLSREDVLAARAAGGWKDGDEYSPWNREDGGPDHPEFRGRSMWWKTALKRSEPWTPTSAADKRSHTAVAAAPQQRPAAVLAAPSPAAPAVSNGGGRQALPAARQKLARPRQRPAAEAPPPRGDVVAQALRTALDERFEKIGVADGDERDNYLHMLANKQHGENLTAHDLRGALGDLAELGEGATVADLQELCKPEPEAS